MQAMDWSSTIIKAKFSTNVSFSKLNSFGYIVAIMQASQVCFGLKDRQISEYNNTLHRHACYLLVYVTPFIPPIDLVTRPFFPVISDRQRKYQQTSTPLIKPMLRSL